MEFVLKTCERIFGLKNFSLHEMFLVISQCRKRLVMSTPKPDNCMQLFWTLADVPVWPRYAKNADEYFTKFIPSKLMKFFPVSFFTLLLAKSSKWMKHLYKFK